MTEPKSKISATLIFSGDRKIQSINLNAETDGDAAELVSAIDQILKRPENELEELAIRLKWLTAIVKRPRWNIAWRWQRAAGGDEKQ